MSDQMNDFYDDLYDIAIEECEACRAGAPTVTDEELEQLTPHVPDWEVLETDGIKRLHRSFEFDGWMPAVRFVDAVAQAAEDNDHHPNIVLEWGKVTITWYTHKIRGLHRNDFIMAAKTDTIRKAMT